MRKNLALIGCLLMFPLIGQAETVFTAPDSSQKMATGLMQLPDYKYPVYLYVPDNYTAEKDYPFIISIPDEGETPDKNIQYWINVAARRTAIILSVTNLWPDDMPTRMDEWLLRIKKDVADRYRVDKNHTYVVGMESGGHYAAYLSMTYPSEFSAVALLGEAWSGKFEQLIHPSSSTSQQIPIYVVFAKSALTDTVEKAKQQAMELEQKGYIVSLGQLEGTESFSDMEFKLKMLSWLEEKSDDWDLKAAESQKSWKEKFKKWLKRNITA